MITCRKMKVIVSTYSDDDNIKNRKFLYYCPETLRIAVCLTITKLPNTEKIFQNGVIKGERAYLFLTDGKLL